MSKEKTSVEQNKSDKYLITAEWEFTPSKTDVNSTHSIPSQSRSTQPKLATQLYGANDISELKIFEADNFGKERVICETEVKGR